MHRYKHIMHRYIYNHIYIHIYTSRVLFLSISFAQCPRRLHDGCHPPVWLGVPRSGSSMANKCCYVGMANRNGLLMDSQSWRFHVRFIMLYLFFRIELSNCGQSFWTKSSIFLRRFFWFGTCHTFYEPFISKGHVGWTAKFHGCVLCGDADGSDPWR